MRKRKSRGSRKYLVKGITVKFYCPICDTTYDYRRPVDPPIGEDWIPVLFMRIGEEIHQICPHKQKEVLEWHTNPEDLNII